MTTTEGGEPMNQMKPEQMRELDEWCGENVMNWCTHCRNTAFYVKAGTENGIMSSVEAVKDHWRPTTSPADAMAVLEKCLEKDAYATGEFIKGFMKGESLPIEITKFAKQLFGKAGQ